MPHGKPGRHVFSARLIRRSGFCRASTHHLSSVDENFEPGRSLRRLNLTAPARERPVFPLPHRLGPCSYCARRVVAAALLLAAAASPVGAQSSRERPYPVRRATSEIVVDGRVVEEAWADALTLELGRVGRLRLRGRPAGAGCAGRLLRRRSRDGIRLRTDPCVGVPPPGRIDEHDERREQEQARDECHELGGPHVSGPHLFQDGRHGARQADHQSREEQ